MTLDMLLQAFEKGEKVKSRAMTGKDFKQLLKQLGELKERNHG